MRWVLLRSTTFVRAAKKLLKKQPQIAQAFQEALDLLEEEAFHPQLQTHKLKGDLAGYWACSMAYDLRIVFEFVKHEGAEAILLQSVGTHEEVY